MNLHRFEPARLLLGLLLMGAAAAYVVHALGEWQVPAWALLVLVPASLLAAAFTAAATFAVRRLLRRRRRTQPPGAEGRMPMDELRDGYEQSRPGARPDEGDPDEGGGAFGDRPGGPGPGGAGPRTE